MSSRSEQPVYESSLTRCQKELVNEIQFIVIDKLQQEVMLAAADSGEWRLPGFLSREADPNTIPEVCTEAKRLLGFEFPFIVLRETYSQVVTVERPDLSAMLSRTILVIDCLDAPISAPQGYTWVPIVTDQQAVVRVTHSEEDAEQAIRRELEQIVSGVTPPRRVPWASRAWYEEISEWVCQALGEHDLRVVGELKQIRASSRGVVLKINTNRGNYFLKCSPSTSNDAGITSVMSSAAPHLVAKPVVVDVERRRMILADHGEETGWCGLEADDRRKFAGYLARLHSASLPEMSKLVEVGLRVYSPAWMRDNLDSLFGAEELSHMRESDLWRKLHGMKRMLYDDLTEISDWDMPICLVHGDTSVGNLTRSNDEKNAFRFFDFDSSFGSHPIFDLYWCGRDQLEEYAKEMEIADVGKWEKLSRTAFRVAPLIRAFQGLDVVRKAEEGYARSDAIDWLIRDLRLLVL